MTTIKLIRFHRSVAVRAAIIGTTRALNADFCITQDAPLTDRITHAIAALIAAEALLTGNVID